MVENKPCKHVHFMGICGSGCASIALLASDYGYTVTGCDQSDSSYYASELRKKNIPIYLGHDISHITDDVDIVAVSPALFDISPDNPELLLAKEKGILMTWQEFMGRYLQKDKRVIAVAGTHGKTTTTFLTAEILIDAKKDPTVEGGSVYKKWNNGGRSGASDLFVCEADEFNRNFHNYHPETAVLNIVEMDHPECYSTYDEMLDSYRDFVAGSPSLRDLIVNGDSEGCIEVLKRSEEFLSGKGIRVTAFSREEKTYDGFSFPVRKVFYRTIEKTSAGTVFAVNEEGKEHIFRMKMFGEYNVSNAVSAILVSRTYGVADPDIENTLQTFTGVGRRFDPVGECLGIPVFDDYAHHPTEIRAVLTMCRDYFPEKKLLAVFEPHQVSRLRLMFDGFRDALSIADEVVIAKNHLGREVHRDVHPVTKEEWESASAAFHNIEDPEEIVSFVVQKIREGNCGMIVVIGAANSYQISRLLCKVEE